MAALDIPFVMNLSCRDRVGIVTAATDTHFMRVAFLGKRDATLDSFRKVFAPVGRHFEMDWNVWDTRSLQKVLILVSRMDHCLLDLLYRRHLGSLNLKNTIIGSNHEDCPHSCRAQWPAVFLFANHQNHQA